MNTTVVTNNRVKQLLEDYQEGDFYLSSPTRTVLGKGIYKKVGSIDGADIKDDLSSSVKDALSKASREGMSNPVVVGAIPFDEKNKPQLFVPKTTTFSAPYEGRSFVEGQNMTFGELKKQPVPEPEVYVQGVQKGLNLIEEGYLNKLVLSRSLTFHFTEKVRTEEVLQNLSNHNTGGYTFAANITSDHQEHDGHHTFIGASPELLVSKEGTMIAANPLAGSRARSDDPVEDKRRAEELLTSKKDLHEHAVVVKEVVRALQSLCPELSVPDEPSVIQTETMWHLSTEIKGELRDDSVTSLDLALALHPTPAVCGYPTDRAKSAIDDIEPFDRGYFTGMVGWCDDHGDGEWVVAIRCAQLTGCSLSLYAGAGVVAGSKPEEELEETSAKLRTMLHALRIDG